MIYFILDIVSALSLCALALKGAQNHAFRFFNSVCVLQWSILCVREDIVRQRKILQV